MGCLSSDKEHFRDNIIVSPNKTGVSDVGERQMLTCRGAGMDRYQKRKEDLVCAQSIQLNHGEYHGVQWRGGSRDAGKGMRCHCI